MLKGDLRTFASRYNVLNTTGLSILLKIPTPILKRFILYKGEACPKEAGKWAKRASNIVQGGDIIYFLFNVKREVAGKENKSPIE